MVYAYPLWLVIFVFLPLTLIWITQYRTIKKYTSVLGLTVVGAIIFTLPWDALSIKERVWYFTTPQIMGIWFLGLPLEEWLFIISVTLFFTSITIVLWEKMGRKA